MSSAFVSPLNQEAQTWKCTATEHCLHSTCASDRGLGTCNFCQRSNRSQRCGMKGRFQQLWHLQEDAEIMELRLLNKLFPESQSTRRSTSATSTPTHHAAERLRAHAKDDTQALQGLGCLLWIAL